MEFIKVFILLSLGLHLGSTAWTAVSKEYLVQELSKNAITNYHPKQRYTFLRKIGAGKHGIVYEAIKKSSADLHYAIKMLKLTEKKFYIYAINEIEITRNILRNEPHILTYHEAYFADGAFWMVMKHVDGVTLTHVPPPSLTVPALVTIGSVMLKMLSRFEELNICHCDFTKSNMMVERSTGYIYVIDFGLSRRMLPDASKGRDISSKDPNRIRYKSSECSDRRNLYETFAAMVDLAQSSRIKEDARILWIKKSFREITEGKLTPQSLLKVSSVY